MNWSGQIGLLNCSHVLNLWNDFAIAHVLKDNLRITNDNWIRDINGITIDSRIRIVGDVLCYLGWSTMFSTITLHHWNRVLRLHWPVTMYYLLGLLRANQLRPLMQLIRLIIINAWIRSEMLLWVFGTWFLGIVNKVLLILHILIWNLGSLLLVLTNFINWTFIYEVV